ncbi:MAG: P-loop NTPase [Nocardioides sp.]
MTVVVEADSALSGKIAEAADESATVFSTMEDLEQHLTEALDEPVVVLGSSVPLSVATRFAEDARISRPALGVILVRQRVDSQVLAEAIRAGVRDVVEADDLASLSDAVRRARQVASAMRSSSRPPAHAAETPGAEGQVFTVFSSKGGVGKSTLATNLAIALCSLGKRVVAVDLDAQGGDLAIMLQLFPTRSLSDLPTLRGAVDASGVQSLLTEHESGLKVLAAPLQLEARDQIVPEEVGQVITALKQQFDFVVVDTSPGFDDLALTAFDHSDLLVLIGTLDIPALKNLKMAAGTLDLLNIPRERWRLVLNRADARVGLTPAEFEKTLGLSITVSMPTSPDVLAAVNRGEAIVAVSPKHPVSQAVLQLAKQLDREVAPTTDAQPAAPERRSRFRLRR